MKRIGILVIGIVVLVVLSYQVSYALFTDSATSSNNTFTAAAVFPTVSPSTSPTGSPSVSPSITPTPAPGNSDLFVSNGFTCSTGASSTSIVRGQVSIIKTTDLSINVTISGATPNTTYALWVNQNPGACPLPSSTVSSFITTDVNGNGTNTLNGHPLVNTATAFWVSLVGGSDVFRSQAVNL